MHAYVVESAAKAGVRRTEVPDPQPKPNEVVIEVEAFSLNRGELPGHGMFADGMIPGWDSAGKVIQEAADGSGPKAGTLVVGFGANGAWAQKRALATSDVAAVPDGVGPDRASTLPVAGVTALRGLRSLGPILGRRVLITGASGGVGKFAVQIARLGGATVVALGSSPEKAEALRKDGVDEAVSDLAQLTAPVFGVIENVGGRVLVDAWTHLEPGGTLSSIGYASGEPASFSPYSTVGTACRLIAFQIAQSEPGRALEPDLGFLARLVAEGRLDSPIVWSGGWERLPEALQLLDGRKISGKAVLQVS